MSATLTTDLTPGVVMYIVTVEVAPQDMALLRRLTGATVPEDVVQRVVDLTIAMAEESSGD